MPRLKTRCTSCAHLKIACDRGVPKCEYCSHTGRECVYETSKTRGRKSNVVQESSIETVAFQLDPHNSGINSDIESGTRWQELNLGVDAGTNGQFEETQLNSDQTDLAFNLNDLNINWNNVDRVPEEQIDAPDNQTMTIGHHSTGLIDQIGSGDTEEIDRSLLEDYQTLMDPHIYTQMTLNSVRRRLGISRFEHRLLNFFNVWTIDDAIARSGSMENFNPSVEMWCFELPYIWQKNLTVRKNVYSLASLILQFRVDLYGLFLEDFKRDSVDEFLGSSNIPLSAGADILNNLVHSTCYVQDLRMSDIEAKSLQYFGSSLKETTDELFGLCEGKDDIDPEAAFEVLVAVELVYSFLLLQPYQLLPLTDVSNPTSDLIHFIKSTVRAYFRLYNSLINSQYERALYLYKKMATDPDISESFLIIDHLTKVVDDFKANEFDPVLNKDSMGATEEDYHRFYDAIRWFKRALNVASDTNYVTTIFLWFFHVDHRFYDLLYKEHYLCLKLLFYWSGLATMLGFQLDPNKNLWIDYVRWFKAQSHQDKYWTQYDTNFYQIVSSGYIILDASILMHFDPGDHLPPSNVLM